jgi:CRP/FNR family transcriptional regulator, cyclic AMP receptor protein
MNFSGPDRIRVCEADPDLLTDLDDHTARHLRARLAPRCVWAEEGDWRPAFADDELRGHLGLLVIEGLLVRTLRLAGRECSELVGPGDLIRPWESDDLGGSVRCTSDWRALQATSFAALDATFATTIAPWPTIYAQLLSRSARRCRSLVHQATIAHVRSAPTRLLLELWHLADRWGRVTREGVVVPVPLTHQLLAQLTCLQRPTVSAALGQLTRAGEVSRLGTGWVLHGGPPLSAASDDPAIAA